MAAKIILRSPRYPVIGLREALEKTREVYAKDRRNKIPKDIVAEHLGYGGLNGASLPTISALTKYGLLEGGRDSMWVTDRAVTIFVHDKGNPERIEAVKAAAQEPELFRAIDEAFPSRGSDSGIRAFLVTKREFIESSAERLIRSYRETQEFVEEESGGYEASPSVSESVNIPAPHGRPPVPSDVAAAIQGQRPLATIGLTDAANALGLRGLNGEEREWLRGPLSRETNYRVLVNGPMGPKQIGKLIKLLQAQQAVLQDDEDES